MGNDLDDLRNYVSRATHDHTIANSQSEALDLVHVMQSSIAHGNTTHEDWLKPRYRRNSAGSTHLEFDIEYRRRFFFGWKFISHGPTRATRISAKLQLKLKVVDL